MRLKCIRRLAAKQVKPVDGYINSKSQTSDVTGFDVRARACVWCLCLKCLFKNQTIPLCPNALCWLVDNKIRLDRAISSLACSWNWQFIHARILTFTLRTATPNQASAETEAVSRMRDASFPTDLNQLDLIKRCGLIMGKNGAVGKLAWSRVNVGCGALVCTAQPSWLFKSTNSMSESKKSTARSNPLIIFANRCWKNNQA